MDAAMCCMAGLAVFFYRRMFPYCRTPFICMAFETELLGVICSDGTSIEATMGRMTGRATYFVFKDRVM
jgi:hypothetical protein